MCLTHTHVSDTHANRYPFLIAVGPLYFQTVKGSCVCAARGLYALHWLIHALHGLTHALHGLMNALRWLTHALHWLIAAYATLAYRRIA